MITVGFHSLFLIDLCKNRELSYFPVYHQISVSFESIFKYQSSVKLLSRYISKRIENLDRKF